MNLLREKARTLGHHRAQCSDAPDMSGVNAAAAANADLGKEALAWYKQAYADQAPAREAAAKRADEVSLAQIDSMKTQDALAKDYADYGRTTFRPLERSLVADAQNFDTEGKRAELAGLALGDVNQQFAAARDQATRSLSRAGVNPADGRTTGTTERLALGRALAGADAQNKARMQATTMGHAMKMDAASLGRNLPSQQATSASLASQVGNSAVGNAQVPVQLAQGATQLAGQGYGTAIGANNSAGNLYLGAAQVQQKADDNSGLWGAAGAALGGWAGGVFKMPR